MSSTAIDKIIDWRVIPMPPGYVLWWINDGELFAPTPIIGWTYYRYRRNDEQTFFWDQHPITPEDACPGDDQEYAIQYPDGQVHFPNDRTVASFEEAQKYVKKSFEEQQAAAAKRAPREAEVRDHGRTK